MKAERLGRSLVGLVMLGVALSATAQPYRLMFKPEAGSTARYEITIRTKSNLPENPILPSNNTTTVLRATYLFTKISPAEVRGGLSVKLLSSNADSTFETEEWRKGYHTSFFAPTQNPLQLLLALFPEPEIDEITPSDYLPFPSFPGKNLRVGDYWDMTTSVLELRNTALNEETVVDLKVAGQAVLQFLSVDDRGEGTFEERVSFVRPATKSGFSGEINLEQHTVIKVDMATGTFRSIDAWSRVEATASSEDDGVIPDSELLFVTMQVRALN